MLRFTPAPSPRPPTAEKCTSGSAADQHAADQHVAFEAHDASAPDEPAIGLTTLTDGGQRAADVAREIAGFVSAAEESVDVAVYDVRFETDAGGLVLASLLAAQQRGVDVRLLYNVAHPGPIPVPPPPETKPEALEALPVPTRGVAGIPDLMHHKFVVRDRRAVLTGSTNWTDDSWTRQENVMLSVRSPEVAYGYSLAFGQLWEIGCVGEVGQGRPAVGDRRIRAGPGLVRPRARRGALAPRREAHREGARRVRIASPVLTSGPILATLVEVVNEQRCDVAGIVDETQVDQVFYQWRTNGVSEWKIPLLRRILDGAAFSGKNVDPLDAGVRARLHAREGRRRRRHRLRGKLQLLEVGRARTPRTCSRSATPRLADRLAAYVDEVRARYPRTTPPG